MLKVKRTSKGRRKIEIKKIEEDNSRRQVTFSKRRTGLFHKVSELCILTGAEAVILVQSPGNRLFAFANPNVDSVIDRYLSNSNSPENNIPASEVDVDSVCVSEKYNKEYLEISKELEIEENKSKVVNFENSGENLFWWEKSYENLEVEEVEKYINSMEELMKNVKAKADEILLSSSSISELNSNNGDFVHQVIPNTNEVVPDYDYGYANQREMLNDYNYDFVNGEEQFYGDYSNNFEVLGDFGSNNVDVNGFSFGAVEDFM